MANQELKALERDFIKALNAYYDYVDAADLDFATDRSLLRVAEGRAFQARGAKAVARRKAREAAK